MGDHMLVLLLAVGVASQTPGCEVGCDCRGELKFTLCSQGLFTHLPSGIPPSTELLDLSINQIGFIPTGSFQTVRKMRILLLNNNNISAVADGAFSQLEFLQRLDLSWNSISYLKEGFSLGLGMLRELQLAHNRLTTLNPKSFHHMDGLQRLNLTANAIQSVQLRSFTSMSLLRQLHLEDNRLTSLDNGAFSMLRSLEVLNLEANQISRADTGVFKSLANLALLNLAHNRMSSIHFKTLLSVHTYSTHVLLEGNPWHCDCDLQRVFRKLLSVQKLFLDDYYNLSCRTPAVLGGHRLMDTELCIAETVTVLIITVTVVVTVLAAMVMGERKRKRRKKVKHWTLQAADLSDESDHN